MSTPHPDPKMKEEQQNALPAAHGRRFEFLDGLRGIAALLVTFLHLYTTMDERTPAKLPFFLKTIFENGHLGVQIFFVLSGFVIAYSIRNENISFSFIGRFLIRRSIRLDPPFWVALSLLTTLILLGPLLFNQGAQYLPTLSEFLINAFYLPGLLQEKFILPVAWTLCLEIQFYLLFIFLVKGVQNLNTAFHYSPFHFASPISIGVFFLFFMASLLKANEWISWFSFAGLFLPYWYSFFMGSLTCWVLLGMIKEIHWGIAFAFIGLFAFFSLNQDMIATLITTGLIFFVGKKDKLHVFLKGSLFQYLGKISYSLYLIHWPIGMKFITLLSFMMGTYFYAVPPIFLMGISTLVAVLAAHVFYLLVEQPSLQLSKNFGKSKKIFNSPYAKGPTFRLSQSLGVETEQQRQY